VTNPEPVNESIRQWYDRTTRKWRRFLWCASAATLAVMAVAFLSLSTPTLAKIQTFNGALTIPLWGGLWILSFILMFLVPSREASFRGQESLDATSALVRDAIQNDLKPAAQQWRKLADQVQGELNGGLLSDFKEMVKTMKETAVSVKDTAAALKETAQKLQVSADSSSKELHETSEELKKFSADAKKFADDTRPVIETFQKIEGRMAQALDTGFLDKITDAMEGIQRLSPPPVPTGPAVPGQPAPVRKEPNLDLAFKMTKKAVPPPPPSGAAAGPAPVSAPSQEGHTPAVVAQAAAAPQVPQGGQSAAPVGNAPVKVEKIQ
jgi:hypothetical protein